jgi:hypothetical protein
MPWTIAEACDKLEGSPQTKWDRVDIKTHVGDQQVSIQVKFQGDDNEALCFSDQLFDVDAWTRFGKAVRNISLPVFALGRRMLVEDAADTNGDPLTATERCTNAFVSEVKHNNSIVVAKIELTGLSINDLGYFITNNKALKTLLLASREQVSSVQSAILSEAISSAQLEEVNIRHCRFRNDEAFERI